MSLNDPQWGNRGNDNGGGKRPNQGPPDLEELWRDLNRRLSGVFDKKGGSGNGGSNKPPVEFNPKFLGGGIGLLAGLVAYLALSVQDLRRRLARPEAERTESACLLYPSDPASDTTRFHSALRCCLPT